MLCQAAVNNYHQNMSKIFMVTERTDTVLNQNKDICNTDVQVRQNNSIDLPLRLHCCFCCCMHKSN